MTRPLVLTATVEPLAPAEDHWTTQLGDFQLCAEIIFEDSFGGFAAGITNCRSSQTDCWFHQPGK